VLRTGTLRWLLLLVIVAVVETACGPIRSTAGLVDAQKMLKAAENEQAEKFALYEMTLARRYMDKAYEELGYNDYYAAEQMAQKAEGYAETALQKALGTEIIDPSDLGPAIEEPDLEVIPEEGELAPDRRTGDEDVGDVILEQEDLTTPTETETEKTEEKAEEKEETTPASPWDTGS
jgi:Domain of unknown function (DUF4398)